MTNILAGPASHNTGLAGKNFNVPKHAQSVTTMTPFLKGGKPAKSNRFIQPMHDNSSTKNIPADRSRSLSNGKRRS
jgi:hypothetical protein